jgi:catechol 2,3-dioxygenase-like lactoylglutathione lyase family enzyme
MLSQHNVAVNLAVKDLPAARRFYEEVLCLAPVGTQPSQAGSDPALIAYRAGGTSIYVYVSEFAGTNQATACTWSVGGELEAIVSALKAKGVQFEHYDKMPGVKLEGDIHCFEPPPTEPGKPAHAGQHRIAWFKDPAGNILSLVNS